jgi:hypothetical protein
MKHTLIYTAAALMALGLYSASAHAGPNPAACLTSGPQIPVILAQNGQAGFGSVAQEGTFLCVEAADNANGCWQVVPSTNPNYQQAIVCGSPGQILPQ